MAEDMAAPADVESVSRVDIRDAKGVVVRGSDASGHWANPPRPVED